MRLYFEVARRSFLRYATYRSATLAGVFTNTAFGFIRAYVLIAVFAAVPRIGGYGAKDALTYVFISQALLMALHFWGWFDVEERVRSGDIAMDLLRPHGFLGYWLASDMGRAMFHLLARGIPPFAVAGVFFQLRLPESYATWIWFLVSTFIAVTISLAIRVAVNVTAFWLGDCRGVMIIVSTAWMFLSGFMIPVVMFPDWLKKVAAAVPFAATFNTPAEIFLEKVTGFDLVAALGVQAAWALAMLGLAELLFRLGIKRLVIQGG